LFLLPPYTVLLGIGMYQCSLGVGGLGKDRVSGRKMEFNDDDAQRFHTVAPYIFGFLILMATIYFAKQFFQSIYPLTKDVRERKKSLIYYKPAKSAMPFFNRYYLSTPLYKNQQIEISREDFESIPESNELCLEVGSNSTFILRLRNGEKEIKYYQIKFFQPLHLLHLSAYTAIPPACSLVPQ
jgi:hypothetical protein